MTILVHTPNLPSSLECPKKDTARKCTQPTTTRRKPSHSHSIEIEETDTPRHNNSLPKPMIGRRWACIKKHSNQRSPMKDRIEIPIKGTLTKNQLSQFSLTKGKRIMDTERSNTGLADKCRPNRGRSTTTTNPLGRERVTKRKALNR